MVGPAPVGLFSSLASHFAAVSNLFASATSTTSPFQQWGSAPVPNLTPTVRRARPNPVTASVIPSSPLPPSSSISTPDVDPGEVSSAIDSSEEELSGSEDDDDSSSVISDSDDEGGDPIIEPPVSVPIPGGSAVVDDPLPSDESDIAGDDPGPLPPVGEGGYHNIQLLRGHGLWLSQQRGFYALLISRDWSDHVTRDSAIGANNLDFPPSWGSGLYRITQHSLQYYTLQWEVVHQWSAKEKLVLQSLLTPPVFFTLS